MDINFSKTPARLVIEKEDKNIMFNTQVNSIQVHFIIDGKNTGHTYKFN